MGHGFCCFSKCYSDCFNEPRAQITMLGLDNSGKTTALYRLKMNEPVEAIPTCGFNIEELTTASGMELSVIDVAGGRRFNRAMYCTGCEGVIFVVDSNNEERFAEARDELKSLMLADPTPCGIPLLVMANKQDLPESVDPSKLTEALGLQEFTCNEWMIQGTSAATGEGLHESIETLHEMIKRFRKGRR